MKQKKPDWFTKNSTILFIVFLCLGILFFNLFISGIKNYRIDYYWTTLLATIVSLLVTLIMILFLVFIIYYEDHRQSKNKRKFKLFELVIKKFLDKGADS